MARPMPVPGYSSRACSRWKITKIRSKYCRVDADAVVADAEQPLAAVALARSTCTRAAAAPRNLRALPSRFGQQLLELARVAEHGRQGRVGDVAPDSSIAARRSVERLVAAPRPRSVGSSAAAPRADPREGEQVLDEVLHALHARDGEVDELLGVAVRAGPGSGAPAAARSSPPCAAAPAGRATRRRRTAPAPRSTAAALPRPAFAG